MTYPTIFAKCSHDLDLIQHYAGAECDTVSSIGGLSFFRNENAPQGAAERCLDCPYVEKCPYSVKKIYIDNFMMDDRNGTIEVFRYGEEKEVISVDSLIEAGYSHGGGEQILIDCLYLILNNECENRTSLRESAESHLMGIAAEKSRLSGGKAVKINR